MLLSYGVSVTARDLLDFTPARYAGVTSHWALEHDLLMTETNGPRQEPLKPNQLNQLNQPASRPTPDLNTPLNDQPNRPSNRSSNSDLQRESNNGQGRVSGSRRPEKSG